jgi:hypothetical protein
VKLFLSISVWNGTQGLVSNLYIVSIQGMYDGEGIPSTRNVLICKRQSMKLREDNYKRSQCSGSCQHGSSYIVKL